MVIDRVMADMKLGIMDGDIPAGAQRVIRDGAEAFLRAGGMVTWELWSLMSDVTRAAFVEAGNSIAAEWCVMAGLSAQGPQQAAAIMASCDGGDMQARMILKQAADRMEKQMNGKEFKA